MKKFKKSKVKRKLTLIKVLGQDGKVTQADLEKWQKIFADKRMTLKQAVATGEISAEDIAVRQSEADENYVTFIKIGGEHHMPTLEELDRWRNMFMEGIDDPDFKIFTYPYVEIEVVKMGEIVAVD